MVGVLRLDHSTDWVARYAKEFRSLLVFDQFSVRYPHFRLYSYIDNQCVTGSINAIPFSGVDFISAGGHGAAEAFFGADSLPIWEETYINGGLLTSRVSDQRFRGKIVHLTSCKSGAFLGPMMVAQGARAFWGYSQRFEFYYTPIAGGVDAVAIKDDEQARLFFEMDALIDLGILRRKSALEIHDDVWEYVCSKIPNLDRIVGGALIANFMSLVCPTRDLGSISATLPL